MALVDLPSPTSTEMDRREGATVRITRRIALFLQQQTLLNPSAFVVVLSSTSGISRNFAMLMTREIRAIAMNPRFIFVVANPTVTKDLLISDDTELTRDLSSMIPLSADLLASWAFSLSDPAQHEALRLAISQRVRKDKEREHIRRLLPSLGRFDMKGFLTVMKKKPQKKHFLLDYRFLAYGDSETSHSKSIPISDISDVIFKPQRVENTELRHTLTVVHRRGVLTVAAVTADELRPWDSALRANIWADGLCALIGTEITREVIVDTLSQEGYQIDQTFLSRLGESELSPVSALRGQASPQLSPEAELYLRKKSFFTFRKGRRV